MVCPSRRELLTNLQRRALKLAKQFLRRSALLNQDMSVAFHERISDVTDTEVPWDGSVQLSEGKPTAPELPQTVVLEEQMKELASHQMPDKQETAHNAKDKEKEKQKEKKKRRKRHMQGKRAAPAETT